MKTVCLTPSYEDFDSIPVIIAIPYADDTLYKLAIELNLLGSGIFALRYFDHPKQKGRSLSSLNLLFKQQVSMLKKKHRNVVVIELFSKNLKHLQFANSMKKSFIYAPKIRNNDISYHAQTFGKYPDISAYQNVSKPLKKNFFGKKVYERQKDIFGMQMAFDISRYNEDGYIKESAQSLRELVYILTGALKYFENPNLK